MNPLRPGTHKYPTNQRLNVSLAFKDNKNRWQRTAKRINDVIRKLTYTKEIVAKEDAPTVRKADKRTVLLTNMGYISSWFARNSEYPVSAKILRGEIAILTGNATRYEYEVSPALMDMTMETINNILEDDLLSGSDFWDNRFWLNTYIESASNDGTTDSFESAVRITTGSPVEGNLSILTAQQQLMSPVYLDRLRLIHGRVFESMKGLTSDMKAQLRLTLTEGMARGIGIRDLTGMINKRLAVGMVRAKRIARTEINQAYRQAYMSEAKELNDTALKGDQWKIMQCHRSALSPTTRKTHAARHGNVYTMQQQLDWWAEGSNSIQCLCSTLDVLYNVKTGEILQQKMIDNMSKQKSQWFGIPVD